MNEQPIETSSTDNSAFHIALWLDSRQLPQEAAFIYSLAVAAKAEGCRVSVVAPAEADMGFLPALGPPVLLRPAGMAPTWLRSIRRPCMEIINQLKNAEVDVVVQFAPRDASDPMEASLPRELPVIRWIWDTMDLSVRSSLDRDTSHLIVVSQHALDQLGPDQSHISLIRPGILGVNLFSCAQRPPARPGCMVCLDAISDYQAFADLLDACRRLLDEKIDFLLFLCDVGKAAHGIWKLSGELGLLDRISFIPYRYDIDPLLAQADVYIQLTGSSRINYTTLRAMARNIPVIADPGINDEFCVDGETCRAMEHGRPDLLGETLRDILTHASSAREMAMRAAMNVQRYYGMNDAVLRLIAISRQASGNPLALRSKNTTSRSRGLSE